MATTLRSTSPTRIGRGTGPLFFLRKQTLLSSIHRACSGSALAAAAAFKMRKAELSGPDVAAAADAQRFFQVLGAQA